jgi:hypothetical protein
VVVIHKDKAMNLMNPGLPTFTRAAMPATLYQPRPQIDRGVTTPAFTGNKAEDEMGRAMAGILLGILSLVGLAGTAAGKWGHTFFPSGRSHAVVQTALDDYIERKERPNGGQEAFTDTLAAVQQELGKHATGPDTKQIAALVPGGLSETEQAKLQALLTSAKTASTVSDLKPLFQDWLTVLEKHSATPIDRAAVDADVTAYFNTMSRFETIQNVFLGGIILSCLGLAGSGYLLVGRSRY